MFYFMRTSIARALQNKLPCRKVWNFGGCITNRNVCAHSRPSPHVTLEKPAFPVFLSKIAKPVLQEKPVVDEDRSQHCPGRLLMQADGNRAWVATTCTTHFYGFI